MKSVGEGVILMNTLNKIEQIIDSVLLDDLQESYPKEILYDIKRVLDSGKNPKIADLSTVYPLFVKLKNEICEWIGLPEPMVIEKIKNKLFTPTEVKLILTNMFLVVEEKEEADESLY